MMTLDANLTLTILLSLAGVTLVVMLVWFRVILTRLQHQITGIKTKMQVMEKQAGMLTSGSLGMGQRMVALEKKIHSLQDKQDDMSHTGQDFSYTQAQQLIEQGIDNKTVAANSGLSMSEIELMQMLHQHSRQKNAMAHG